MSLPIFDDLVDNVVDMVEPLCEELQQLPIEKQIEALNRIRAKLHAASPFSTEPIDLVLWLPADEVEGNDYNPNSVAAPEMRLLRLSIDKDGYTQPIVGWESKDSYHVEVVDGEHRTRVGKQTKYIRKRLHGHLPVTLIKQNRQGRNDRIAATVRHNRARGVHGVAPMADIVTELIQLGWTDGEIAKELGMDADEVLRFKQNTGIPELFARHPYSNAWE